MYLEILSLIKIDTRKKVTTKRQTTKVKKHYTKYRLINTNSTKDDILKTND